MKGNMEQRACEEAVYIIESRGTVRDAARKFGISKSTVHKDISQRLPLFNRSLYLQVKAILEENKAPHTRRPGHPAQVQGRLKSPQKEKDFKFFLEVLFCGCPQVLLCMQSTVCY